MLEQFIVDFAKQIHPSPNKAGFVELCQWLLIMFRLSIAALFLIVFGLIVKNRLLWLGALGLIALIAIALGFIWLDGRKMREQQAQKQKKK